jgi:hypothetical protein
METKKVKNISDSELAIVGVGMVKAGEIIEVPADFNNPNFAEKFKEIENKNEKETDLAVKSK